MRVEKKAKDLTDAEKIHELIKFMSYKDAIKTIKEGRDFIIVQP